MTPDEFSELARFVKRRSGIALAPHKRTLASSKLKPVVVRFGFHAISDLVAELPRATPALARDVIGAITTNETSFFRDKAVFDHLRHDILPPLLLSRMSSRRLRIWCAAASTGQEPYSVAALLEDFRPLMKGWTVDILASDIAADAIARAREGVYDAHEVARGLSREMLLKNFRRDHGQYRVDKSLRARVSFGIRNLIEPFADLGTFDLILCRNVLIYFDDLAKRDVLNRLRAVLAPDGCLVLGANETLMGFGNALEPVDGVRGIYTHPRSPMRRLAAG